VRKLCITVSFIVWVMFFVCSCGEKPLFVSDSASQINPWTNQKFLNDPSEFHFAIVSDRNGGERAGVFADAVTKLNLLQPEFVLCVGDLISGGTQDEKILSEQWNDLDSQIKRLEPPFFYLPGNHDIPNDVALKLWKQQHGRPYYHFIYKNVLFLCMNSQGGSEKCQPETLSRDQIDYFRKVLASNRQVRWTFVFVHRPLWEYPATAPVWAEIETALGDRPYTVFSGHTHLYAYQVRRGHKYITMATTGGAAELNRLQAGRGDMIRLGSFDHVAWVTMTKKGPKIANLMLDGIYDEQVASAETTDMAEQLNDREIITYEVIPDVASQGQTTIRMTLKNDTPASMAIKGYFEPMQGVTITPPTFEESLPPGGKKSLEFGLQGLAPLPAGDARNTPAILKNTVTFSMPGFGPITRDISLPISLKPQ
jgi:hypothetical protein